jgi:hypothetical protein
VGREELSCLREAGREGEGGDEIMLLNEELEKRSKLLEMRKRRREERRKMERIEIMERLRSERRVRREAMGEMGKG